MNKLPMHAIGKCFTTLNPANEMGLVYLAGKMISCFKVRKQKSEKERLFMKNGGLLLEALVASCDGKCNPIRSFSSEELKKATNNYDHQRIIQMDCDYNLYTGVLQDRPVSIKKYICFMKQNLDIIERVLDLAVNDIVIGSQVSAHNNALKLLGCCLETELPIIVYEFMGNKTLSHLLRAPARRHSPVLSWKQRIKIAMGIANGVAYLHTALLRPVIHRDIRPQTIIIDQEFNAKLFEFSFSIAIPDGQLHVSVNCIWGRSSFIPHEYLSSGKLTEKLDVFSLGVVLIELLTGRRASPSSEIFISPDQRHLQIGELKKIVDGSIWDEGIEQQDLLPFAALALSCIRREAEDRPTMIRVAKELKQIYQSVPVVSSPTS